MSGVLEVAEGLYYCVENDEAAGACLSVARVINLSDKDGFFPCTLLPLAPSGDKVWGKDRVAIGNGIRSKKCLTQVVEWVDPVIVASILEKSGMVGIEF